MACKEERKGNTKQKMNKEQFKHMRKRRQQKTSPKRHPHGIEIDKKTVYNLPSIRTHRLYELKKSIKT